MSARRVLLDVHIRVEEATHCTFKPGSESPKTPAPAVALSEEHLHGLDNWQGSYLDDDDIWALPCTAISICI